MGYPGVNRQTGFPANWHKTPEFSLYFRVEFAFNPPNLE